MARSCASETRFVDANRRPISMVFQSYAIWPHMTVLGNVTFPLSYRGAEGSGGVDQGAARTWHGSAEDGAARPSGGPGCTVYQRRPAAARGARARAGRGARRCLLLDEPLAIWTPSCARGSGRRSAASRTGPSGSESRRSTSPTIRPKRCRCPTALRSCRGAGVLPARIAAGNISRAGLGVGRADRRQCQRAAGRHRQGHGRDERGPARQRQGAAVSQPRGCEEGGRCRGRVPAGTCHCGAQGREGPSGGQAGREPDGQRNSRPGWAGSTSPAITSRSNSRPTTGRSQRSSCPTYRSPRAARRCSW